MLFCKRLNKKGFVSLFFIFSFVLLSVFADQDLERRKMLFIFPSDDIIPFYDALPPSPEVYCCNTDGSCSYFYSTQECTNFGGAVMNCLGKQSNQQAPTPKENLPADEINKSDQFIKDLIIALKASPLRYKVYDSDNYNCANFAHDLEQYLANLSYNTTFTSVIEYDAQNKIKSRHSITDVHKPNGKIIFIEPQFIKYFDTFNMIQDEQVFLNYALDVNHDDQFTVHNRQNIVEDPVEKTEGNKQLNIYKNSTEAEKFGFYFPSLHE
ncbi:MAG: hypothetical protein AABW41_04950 [Nanoarchaeota archaeon]